MWYYQSLETSVNVYQHLSVQNISSFVFGHGLTAVVRKKPSGLAGGIGLLLAGVREGGRGGERKGHAAGVPQIDFEDQNTFSGADLHQLTLIHRSCLETLARHQHRQHPQLGCRCVAPQPHRVNYLKMFQNKIIPLWSMDRFVWPQHLSRRY